MTETKSYDLANTLQAFYGMSTNYGNMMEVITELEAARDLVKAREYIQHDSSGKQLINRMQGINDTTISIRGSESKAAKMIDEYFKVQVYGQKTKDLGYFDLGFTQLDKNKLASNLKGYNSITMIGFNVLAGTANVLQGESMQLAEAHAGEFFDKSSYHKASKEYTRNMAGIMGDVGERRPKNKVNLMNDYYNILGDYVDKEGIKASEESKLKRSMTTSTLFFINQAGEHLMQSRAAMAIMHSTPVFTATGEKAGNLYDAHSSKNGRLVIADVYIKEGNELVKFGARQKDDFTRKTQTVLRRMHGNYNSQTAAMWQSNAYLELIGQFRKWIRTGWMRRFESKRYNEFLDSETEGNYVSVFNFSKKLFKDMRTMQFDLMKEDWNGMTSLERANMRRTIVDVLVITATAIAGELLIALSQYVDDEDKEGDDKLKLAMVRFLAYETNRLYAEARFFSSPGEALGILRSPAASISTIESWTRLMTQIMPWNASEEYKKGYRKGELKLWKRVGDVAPIYKQIAKLGPEGLKNQLDWFNMK